MKVTERPDRNLVDLARRSTSAVWSVMRRARSCSASFAGKVTKRVAVIYGAQRFVLRPEVPQVRLDADASVDAALRRSGDNPFSRVIGGSDARGTVTPRISYSRAALEDFAADR